MKSGKAGKMATTLTVLLLVLSGLAVVQWNAQPVEAIEEEDDSAHTYLVEGFLDTDVSIESNLDIELRDLSTGEVRTESTDEEYYVFTDLTPGWYEIIFPSQVVDDIAYMENSTELRVDEDKFGQDIEIDAEEADETVTGYVYDEDGEPIENATVSLEDRERGFAYSVRTETIVEEVDGDNETLSKYEIEIYEDFDGLLKIEKEGYAPYVNPEFTLEEEYELTIDVEGNGTTDPAEGTHVYEEGTEVTVTATANEGWYFEEWTGDETGTEEQIDIIMDADKEVTARFEEEEEPPEEYQLTINTEGNGTTDPAEGTHVYEEGEVVTVEATPAEGWQFVEWTGDETGTETTIEVTMDEDKSITANFEEEGNGYGLTEKASSYDVTLYTEPRIEGRLLDEDGRAIREDLDITVHNEDLGIFQNEKEGPTFRIRAPANYDYTLVVDAPGYEPLVKEVEDLEGIEKMGGQEVKEALPEEFENEVEFDDFDDLTVHSTRTLNPATRMKTLDFSQIGNLRMQIDLALGDADGYVCETEAELFVERLEYSEADIPSTYGFITVNDTFYELEDHEFDAEDVIDAIEGPVEETFDEITVDATRHYGSIGDVSVIDADLLNLTVQNDHLFGNERDFTYTLYLPEGYERYIGEETAQLIPEDVEVEGYTTIDINPGEEEMTSDITFDIRESEEGEVEIILEREPWIYEHEEKENYTVIRKDTEAEITARYENPISHALNYTWLLNQEEIESGEDASELTHAFNETGEKHLEVEVEESSSTVITDNITIMVDDEGPQGENITVDGEYIELGGTATVDEDTDIYFNASAFEDYATGMISNYEWNFTDTNETRSGANMTNVSHTFTSPGEYEVRLNLTDPVGNWNEVNISVKVNDTTSPNVVIKAEWDDHESSDPSIEITRNTEVRFNGTESQAHPDYEGNLTFEWEIEELDEEETGPFFNHTFEEVDDYTVILYATDEAGNTGNQTMEVNTLRGATPNLRVGDLTFSTRDIREGDDVTISVNITNDGEANATSLNPVLRVDEEIVSISPVYYQDGEELEQPRIDSGETIKMEVIWTPETDGDITISVNVTDGEEPSDLYFNNELEDTVTVDPPAWREYIVYALIPIIIIGVTVGLYFYKDKIKEMLGR